MLVATGCSSSSDPAPSSSSSPDQPVKAAPIKTEGLSKDSVCKITHSEAQQKTLGVWKAGPMEGKGETSCYVSMTPDTANAAGYGVSCFENEEALLGTADAAGASPTKPCPSP
jgi:hypothetical protein